MEYTHPIRRRARALRHLLEAASRPATRRRGRVVGAYWWVGSANFGDDLTPWLLPHYGIVAVHRRAAEARLSGVGSILGSLPTSYDGAIWGSGLIADQRHPLPHAKVLAVRGHHSRERIGADADVPLGDPGLLVSRWVRQPATRWDVGLVAHKDHRSHAGFLALAKTAGMRVRVIDVRNSAPRTVREIASCAAIVTTSLHGLVTADAFGLPAAWTTLDPELTGGTFKFRDYESVITPDGSRFFDFDDRPTLSMILDDVAAAPRGLVDASAASLEKAIGRLPEVLHDLPRFPRGVLRVVGDHSRMTGGS